MLYKTRPSYGYVVLTVFAVFALTWAGGFLLERRGGTVNPSEVGFAWACFYASVALLLVTLAWIGVIVSVRGDSTAPVIPEPEEEPARAAPVGFMPLYASDTHVIEGLRVGFRHANLATVHRLARRVAAGDCSLTYASLRADGAGSNPNIEGFLGELHQCGFATVTGREKKFYHMTDKGKEHFSKLATRALPHSGRG